MGRRSGTAARGQREKPALLESAAHFVRARMATRQERAAGLQTAAWRKSQSSGVDR